MTDNVELENEISGLIVETLKLEDVTAEDVEPELPLFGEGGLELDSIDALEIGIAIQKNYGISFDAQDADVQQSFASVRTLADFIQKARTKNGSAELPENPSPS